MYVAPQGYEAGTPAIRSASESRHVQSQALCKEPEFN
jgi:hypothetical protein